jgi:hypothetical protein
MRRRRAFGLGIFRCQFQAIAGHSKPSQTGNRKSKIPYRSGTVPDSHRTSPISQPRQGTRLQPRHDTRPLRQERYQVIRPIILSSTGFVNRLSIQHLERVSVCYTLFYVKPSPVYAETASKRQCANLTHRKPPADSAGPVALRRAGSPHRDGALGQAPRRRRTADAGPYRGHSEQTATGDDCGGSVRRHSGGSSATRQIVTLIL